MGIWREDCISVGKIACEPFYEVYGSRVLGAYSRSAGGFSLLFMEERAISLSFCSLGYKSG